MSPVPQIFGMLIVIAWYVFVIVLIVKIWRACTATEEMNRTVQLMAYDLKALRAELYEAHQKTDTESQ